jgi:hypothetical protein
LAMNLHNLKNSEKYFWTEHAKFKMKFYGLSPQRVLRVIRAPQRVEEGIVANTIAVMQPSSTRMKDGKKIWSSEIWAMYQNKVKSSKFKVKSENKELENILNAKYKIHDTSNSQLSIISAWRYPGVSPDKDPIPREILEELESSIFYQ